MFMYSWRTFAKLKSSTCTIIDHHPYLVWLDADLCKLALNRITFQDKSAVRSIHSHFCERICKMVVIAIAEHFLGRSNNASPVDNKHYQMRNKISEKFEIATISSTIPPRPVREHIRLRSAFYFTVSKCLLSLLWVYTCMSDELFWLSSLNIHCITPTNYCDVCAVLRCCR